MLTFTPDVRFPRARD